MAPKRKNDDSYTGPTARDKKKQKIAAARTIDVQSAPSGRTSNPVAGPSNGPGTTNSMQGLPSSIDVERFAEARAFEINAMQEAMESAKGASTHRAWQELPRHLRRRAASHDVRRVPLRLREKARAEMDPVKRKALTKNLPKRGKGKQVTRTQSFLKRQRDKIWLETHIWHAKRMHMENKWGYRLATTPTEKAYRPSHRASVHGSILHDASYYGLLELKGEQKVLGAVLNCVCDPQGQGPSAKRFTTGARVLETHAYKPRMYPLGLIAPVTVHWKPLPLSEQKEIIPATSSSKPTQLKTTDAEPATDAKRKAKPKTKGNGKGKGKANAPEEETPVEPTSAPPDIVVRTVWVYVHPSAFDDVFAAVQTSASLVLEQLKKSSATAASAPTDADVGMSTEQEKTYEVEIADLREEVNVFEIMGPKASQVIKGALSPVQQDQRPEFRRFWSSLSQLQSSGSMPRGMVVGLKVVDPRLDFPPKNAKVAAPAAHDGLPSLSSPVMTFPTSTLAQSDIWEEQAREKLCKPKFKKKHIDERKAKNLVPGTVLPPGRQDDRIPVLLIQRSVESSDAPLSPSVSLPASSSQQALHGWTVVLPSGWGMPFLSSLVFTGMRVGGQRERAVQAFEAGSASFPRDYVGTAAYEEEAEAHAQEERERWEKRPPAKRVDYEKRGVENPWRPNWDTLLGLPKAGGTEENGKGEFVSAQREEPSATDEDHVADQDMDETLQEMLEDELETVQPWLLRGHDVGFLLTGAADILEPASYLLEAVNKLRAKRNMDPLGNTAEDLWRSAIVGVRISMCGRGKPVENALIYAMDDDEWTKWRKIEATRGNTVTENDIPSEAELGKLAPSKESIIGHVTTGNFSLSLGASSAIGAVPLARFVELMRQTSTLEPTSKAVPRPLVKVRDRDGLVCRAAILHVLQ